MNLEIGSVQAKVLKALIEGVEVSPQEIRELIPLLPCLEQHLENEFLKSCGFDTKHGFHHTDVLKNKRDYPELYKKYII